MVAMEVRNKNVGDFGGFGLVLAQLELRAFTTI
jgi:hypothetical protein